MKQTINVTARDIKYGRRCDGQSCPIARAVLRTKWGKDSEAYNFTVAAKSIIRFYLNRTPDRIDLPQEANEFVRRFDRNQPVEPFSFTIEVPE
jgi:hypothetical protein